MPKLDGGISAGSIMAEMAGFANSSANLNPIEKEAEQMWAKMTKMAQGDPKEYDKFVAQQMLDAQQQQMEQQRNRPQPAFCIESWGKINASGMLLDGGALASSLLVKDRRRLVVSICGSDKVPPLSSTRDGSVPIVLRKPVEPKDDPDQLMTWQAVFHPGVIKKANAHVGPHPPSPTPPSLALGSPSPSQARSVGKALRVCTPRRLLPTSGRCHPAGHTITVYSMW
jgi:hypothetical protein